MWGAVTGVPASHELGGFSPAEISNRYGEVGRNGGPDDGVLSQRTGKGRLLGRSDLCLRPGAGDAPQMGRRHRATCRGWESRGLPFILSSPAPTCCVHARIWWLISRDTILLQKQQFFFHRCSILLFFQLFILYWSIANQQCCDSFRWTAKGLSHTYTRILLRQTPLPSRLPHDVEQSPLCCMATGPCWFSVLNIAKLKLQFLFSLCCVLCCVQFFATPMNCSPPGSSVHGILQARLLEWAAMPSSTRSSWPRD